MKPPVGKDGKDRTPAGSYRGSRCAKKRSRSWLITAVIKQMASQKCANCPGSPVGEKKMQNNPKPIFPIRKSRVQTGAQGSPQNILIHGRLEIMIRFIDRTECWLGRVTNGLIYSKGVGHQDSEFRLGAFGIHRSAVTVRTSMRKTLISCVHKSSFAGLDDTQLQN